MKIIITGASGFVGSLLVSELSGREHELILIGRNKETLANRFLGHQVMTYDEFERSPIKADALVHLAVLNNTSKGSYDDFVKINVALLEKILAASVRKKISRFINVTSTHVFDPGRRDYYSRSKLQAVEYTTDLQRDDVENLALPYVYSRRNWSGKLQWLNAFPPQLGETIFSIAKAFKPTVSISRIVRYVEHKPAMSGDIYILSDWQLDNRFFSFFKRLADILLSLVLSVIMAVPMLMIALMIKLYDGGPILFRQIRVGRNKRLFTCFKFRTMKQNTGDHPTHEIHVDRITRVGHWLRTTKLDELPQLWNVFRSDMSFIGPRPCLPTQKELINERQRLGVFAVKPGISGYAQTRNIDMSTPSKLAYLDQQYAARQSILLDIELMFSTAARLFRDR